VVEVYGEKVVLEIAEDVHIEVTRRAIANIVPPEAEEAGEVDEAEEEDEEEGGEEAGEEPAAEVAATEGEKRAT
jgi:hypothetical protein